MSPSYLTDTRKPDDKAIGVPSISDIGQIHTFPSLHNMFFHSQFAGYPVLFLMLKFEDVNATAK